MVAIGDESVLHFLQFEDHPCIERDIARLQAKAYSTITVGRAASIISIENELVLYFQGELKQFTTPLAFRGSSFQNITWQALFHISYGQTRSYKELAQAIGKPSACRAVANANGANQIVIVIPCHRIITSNGGLGGYSAGIARKKWLLDHEKNKKI